MAITMKECLALLKKTKTKRIKAKSGWRTVGEQRCYFRSAYEANYARYLEFLRGKEDIIKWEYEPKTFWFEEIKRGTRSYLPDFRITTGKTHNHWVEVKGHMDAKSKTKIKRFRKYYPKEILIIVDSLWFAENSNTLRNIIQEWE